MFGFGVIGSSLLATWVVSALSDAKNCFSGYGTQAIFSAKTAPKKHLFVI
jgi:hypothetical protein